MSPALRARMMVAVASCALVNVASCGLSPTPAGILMSKIHGCTNVVTSGGSKQDDNTVSVGRNISSAAGLHQQLTSDTEGRQ